MRTLLDFPGRIDHTPRTTVTYWSRFDDVYCFPLAELEEMGADDERAYLDEFGKESR